MTYRIAQWTLGNVGKVAVEAVREDPELSLVACYTRPGEKTGKDVGELCGIGPIGLSTVSDIEAVIATRPDLVLYMPLMWDVDAMVRLLEAGINVISTANFITGLSYGAGEKARLHEAGLRGGASLYGSGINPGFANILTLLSTQVCRKVTKVSLLESVDASGYDSPETWRSLGFGGPKDAPGLMEQVRQRAGVFADAVEMIADGLKVKLDEIIFEGELGVATMTRLGQAMEPDWSPHQGYRIDIEGEPGVRCQFHTAHPDAGASSGLHTAMPAVNAIPAVIAAKPGLVTAADLPLIVAAGRVG